MSFVSTEFVLFFVAVCALYVRLPHRWQNRMLLLASYIFYGWWDWRFLSLILLSSLVDFAVGRVVDPEGPSPPSERARRWALAASVGTNLGMLGVFKYLGFFVESAQAMLGDLPLPFGTGSLEVILPVGISFYTFQTMSYTIDVHRGAMRSTRRIDDFLLFVAFFPQLVAGPIERAKHLLPQVTRPRDLNPAKAISGLELMLFGFFKKMVVADNLALLVDSIFRAKAEAPPDGALVWLGVYAFAVQIYADFSGYTDIARGAARVLGFDIRRNFRTPYFATNPSDFWERWHVSLSSWLRDYLYIPLGGSRRGPWMTLRNLFITMLLGGLWHGAAWTYVAWGAFHGILLALAHRFMPRGAARSVAHRVRGGVGFWLKCFAYFQLTCAGWLLFRAESGAQALAFARAAVTDASFAALPGPSLLLLAELALPLLLIDIHRYRTDDPEPWTAWRAPVRAAFTVALFYAIVLLGTPHAAEFLYFQF